MDHWVADLAALTEHLNLRDAIHIGHSTGGGEVARYVARHQERVAKAALVASSLKTYPGYPHGMLTTHADVLNPDLLSFIRS
jgi:pimeloyl-ACP methyl ester carboxylesterase